MLDAVFRAVGWKSLCEKVQRVGDECALRQTVEKTAACTQFGSCEKHYTTQRRVFNHGLKWILGCMCAFVTCKFQLLS